MFGRTQRCRAVDEQNDEVGFLDRDGRLFPYRRIDQVRGLRNESARIDQSKGAAGPLRETVVAVARDAGRGVYNGVLFTDEPVKQRTLSHVGAADDGDDGYTVCNFQTKNALNMVYQINNLRNSFLRFKK